MSTLRGAFRLQLAAIALAIVVALYGAWASSAVSGPHPVLAESAQVEEEAESADEEAEAVLPEESETVAAGAQTPSSALLAVTLTNRLVLFNSARPGTITGSVAITGLSGKSEAILGIDYRPADGRLFALSSANRLYTINAATGAATPAGSALNPALSGMEFGFDFNPVPDRIRVVSDAGQNLRLNPETGGVVDADMNVEGVQPDGTLAYAAGDANAGATPRIAGAAYTNSVAGATSTTNYAIDYGLDILVTQGSVNGMPTSPNTGQLFTVGRLGVNASAMLGFDITPGGTAYAALMAPGAATSSLYTVNLTTGAATLVGAIGGEAVRALAVIP